MQLNKYCYFNLENSNKKHEHNEAHNLCKLFTKELNLIKEFVSCKYIIMELQLDQRTDQ